MKAKATKMASKMRRMKAKKVSKVGKKASVFNGTKVRTSGGLKKSDLVKSKSGKVVGKKASANGKKNFKRIAKWTAAFNKARKQLGIKGFCPCGGKTAKGQALLKATRSFYRA